MRRFFQRLATGPDRGADQITSNDGIVHVPQTSEKNTIQGEKSDLRSPLHHRPSAGDRVKTLAARYETLGTTRENGAQNKGSGTQQNTSRQKKESPQNKQSTLSEHQSSKSLAPQLPSENSLSEAILPAVLFAGLGHGETSVRSTSPRETGVWRAPSSHKQNERETRDMNSSSSGINVHKSVAFAPSPKKPIRPASPYGEVPPLPDSAVEEIKSINASSSLAHFAKPTAASTARARNTRQSSSPVPALERYSSGGPSRPGSASANTTNKMRRSSSASHAGMRPHVSSPYDVHASTSTKGLSSTVSLGTREDLERPLQNSIPFVSNLRSASPASINTGSSLSGALPLELSGLSRRGSQSGRASSSGSNGWASSGAKSLGGPSWSEMTQDDLVSNLGTRERTRQEVLWEIVASEERYVQDLQKTKELYLSALLDPVPHDGSPRSTALASLEGRKPRHEKGKGISVTESNKLPIANQYMRISNSAEIDANDTSVPQHPLSRLNTQSSEQSLGLAIETPLSTRSHTRPSSTILPIASERAKTSEKNFRRWSSARQSTTSSALASSQLGYDITAQDGVSMQLSEPLRQVLRVINDGLVEGHTLLSEALKQRYEEQWPLVRSLADVFSRFSYVLRYYRDYVIHLERTLDLLEEAALMERAMRGKRLRKERLSSTVALGRAVNTLEAAAAEKGECGLGIFLAMPFQRLLKYPLLFQNLLFHTDASTYEFESTVQMVVDVEHIVRSIEDEKVNKEERDKTIDAFARIEGIKDKALLRPKSDRVLIEERALYQENPRRSLSESEQRPEDALAKNAMSTPFGVSSSAVRASVRGRRSYRRLSDLLSVGQSASQIDDVASTFTKAPNLGSKRDIWLVRFSDVEVKCQRVGVTALPMVSSVALRSEYVSDTTDRHDEIMEDEARIKNEFKRTKESKERQRALRNTTLRSKTRNLYRFLGVSSWKITRERPNPEETDQMEGLLEADEEEIEDDEDASDESNESQDSDGGMFDSAQYIRQSKLSFSYGGNDRVEPKMTMSQSFQGQSASSSPNLDGLRSSQNAPSKRHSLHSTTLPTITSGLSRTVMVNSKTRAEKFGTRMRPETPLTVQSDDHHNTSAASLPMDSWRRSSAHSASDGIRENGH